MWSCATVLAALVLTGVAVNLLPTLLARVPNYLAFGRTDRGSEEERRVVSATRRTPLGGPTARRHQPILAHSRPRYRPPAAEAHDMGLTRPPKVSATS